MTARASGSSARTTTAQQAHLGAGSVPGRRRDPEHLYQRRVRHPGLSQSDRKTYKRRAAVHATENILMRCRQSRGNRQELTKRRVTPSRREAVKAEGKTKRSDRAHRGRQQYGLRKRSSYRARAVGYIGRGAGAGNGVFCRFCPAAALLVWRTLRATAAGTEV